MHVRSDSFRPFHRLDARWCFGTHDPQTHVALSDNQNPHLVWDDVPPGTRSFVVLCVDEDVPSVGVDVNQEGRTVPLDLPRVSFFHWVLTDLPAGLREIAAASHSDCVTPRGKALGASPSGGLQGSNDYKMWFSGDADMAGEYGGYDGPCPPWNDERVHGYRFQVFALDVVSVGLSGSFTGAEVRAAMEGKVLAKAEIIAIYSINPDA